MGLYDNLNSAWQVHDVMRQFAEQQEQENRMIQNSIARKEKLANAQLGSAEDIRKMLEMMEADQKEQAEENKKNRELALKSYKVSLAAAIFGGASFLAALITLILQLKNQCDALEEKCKSHQLCRCPVGKPFFPAGLFVVLHLLHLLVCTSLLR